MTNLSLFILTRNAGPQVCRAIDSIQGHADELVLVDTGSSDRSLSIIEDHWRKSFPNRRFECVHYNVSMNPEGFILDSPRTFLDGPLAIEDLEVFKEPNSWSYQMFLADFGAARRTGWPLCHGKFTAYLDSDDVWHQPELIPEILVTAEKENLAGIGLPYLYRRDKDGNVVTELVPTRIVMTSHAQWQGRMHETFLVEGKTASLKGFGHVEDKNDLKDPASRVYLRGWKALYKQYLDGDMSARTSFILALESRQVSPRFAWELFMDVAKGDWPERSAKCYYEVGLLMENHYKDLDAAERYYDIAVNTWPSEIDSLYALARLAHYKGNHLSCVALTDAADKRAATVRPAVLQYNPLARTKWPRVFYEKSVAALARKPLATAAATE